MQPLTESIARTEALQQALANFDPASGAMLEKLGHELRDLGSLMRECSILLSLPAIASTSTNLRDRIDLALGTVPRPNPPSLEDGS